MPLLRVRHVCLVACLVLFSPSTAIRADYSEALSDCKNSCQPSGCGSRVGGGCSHICGNLIDSSEQNLRRMGTRFREIAAERTLDEVTRRASIIGIARVREVSVSQPDDVTAKLDFIELWKSNQTSQGIVLDLRPRDSCDRTWYEVREGKLAIFFLVPDAKGRYRVAGDGWALFEIRDLSTFSVATGDMPLPLPVEATLRKEDHRSGPWHASVNDLRPYVRRLVDREPQGHGEEKGDAEK